MRFVLLTTILMGSGADVIISYYSFRVCVNMNYFNISGADVIVSYYTPRVLEWLKDDSERNFTSIRTMMPSPGKHGINFEIHVPYEYMGTE